MKEIKFRGKTFGGKWVEGYYVVEKSTGKHKITDGLLDIDEVKAETVGMSTGVLDKDGTEIFEGDVVQNGEGGYFYIVYWWDEDAAFRGKQVGSSSTIGLNYWRKELRIVGNIHDNPELCYGIFNGVPMFSFDTYDTFFRRQHNGMTQEDYKEFIDACRSDLRDGIDKAKQILKERTWKHLGKRY